jgi:hypothetical protein
MKKIGVIWMIVLVTAPATAAFAGSTLRRGGIAADVPSRAHLAGFVCHPALAQVDRSVTVRASMRPVTGTQKMQMRFELLSQAGPGVAFTQVSGGGLGTWISPPNPNLGQRSGDVWIVSHPVSNLPAPAVYRYSVSFRWMGTGGRVLATRTRMSAQCHQPVFSPDLLVSSISIQSIAGKPKKDQYVATVANDGVGPTPGPFVVSFTPGASSTPGATPMTSTQTVPPLAAGTTAVVTFVGPACTAATAPTVVANPGHKIDESNFANNSLTVDPSCPSVTSAPVPVPGTGG